MIYAGSPARMWVQLMAGRGSRLLRSEGAFVVPASQTDGGMADGKPIAEERMEREIFTKDRIRDFLTEITGRGRSESSIRSYQRALTVLYEALPSFCPEAVTGGERYLDRGTAQAWISWMMAKGTPLRTVNARISAWNSFARYLGRKEWTMEVFSDVEDGVKPELSRAEYVRLLSAACQMGKDKAYMLVLAIGGIGLRVQELPLLTAEAVGEGRILLGNRTGDRGSVLRLPKPLQKEFSGYLKRQGIRSGPVFLTGEGKTLQGSAVNACIRQLCADARVSPEKVTPTCLRNMYEETRKNIRLSALLLAEHSYERLLEEERETVGWDT